MLSIHTRDDKGNHVIQYNVKDIYLHKVLEAVKDYFGHDCKIETIEVHKSIKQIGYQALIWSGCSEHVECIHYFIKGFVAALERE